METAGKCLNQIVLYSKCEQILSIKRVCSRSKCCQNAYFEQLFLGDKFDQTIYYAWGSRCGQNPSPAHVWLGAANVIELLLLSVFALMVNISTVPVLSEFAWAAKCV